MNLSTDALNVEPIPGEPDRFLVQSSSRPGIKHLVDLNYQEEPRDKPRAVCGCEQMQAKGALTCKHLQAVLEYKKHHETT
jgi:hypothetical protein